ncbi:hypothetical protein [Streptomyces sp. NPDC051286]|uniref:ATP-dependent DNA ligase n=1 Tax=Streptomyces sp. NPDC051286 TaxID=3365647 RepID=UPI00379B093F
MEFPIKVALARAVPTLPDGPDWWYEPKFDGHRTVLRRTDDTVFLYARSGRVVTQYWMDLAVAGMELRPGTVLDGEAVIWRDGRLDFAAAQSRAASSVSRARALAVRHRASYAHLPGLPRRTPLDRHHQHLGHRQRHRRHPPRLLHRQHLTVTDHEGPHPAEELLSATGGLRAARHA